MSDTETLDGRINHRQAEALRVALLEGFFLIDAFYAGEPEAGAAIKDKISDALISRDIIRMDQTLRFVQRSML